MIIKITDGIDWDTGQAENQEARQWIAENVTTERNAEKDRYGRPRRWYMETEGAGIEVVREYINPDSGSWARKRDVINVKAKGGES